MAKARYRYPKRLNLERRLYDALSGVSREKYGSIDYAVMEIKALIQNFYRRRVR